MSRRPVIGVTKDASAKPGPTESRFDFYATSVEKAGGTPQAIYYREDLSGVDATLDELDGILFSGGDDLDPALYGQKWHPSAKAVDPARQRWELALLAAAEGMSNNQISEKIGLSRQAVCKWRQRYLRKGISGLHDDEIAATALCFVLNADVFPIHPGSQIVKTFRHG